jgi:hypothetical protein
MSACCGWGGPSVRGARALEDGPVGAAPSARPRRHALLFRPRVARAVHECLLRDAACISCAVPARVPPFHPRTLCRRCPRRWRRQHTRSRRTRSHCQRWMGSSGRMSVRMREKIPTRSTPLSRECPASHQTPGEVGVRVDHGAGSEMEFSICTLAAAGVAREAVCVSCAVPAPSECRPAPRRAPTPSEAFLTSYPNGLAASCASR